MALAPHCPLGPIALAACMQVDIAAPNCASGAVELLASATDFFILHSLSSLHPGAKPAGKRSSPVWVQLGSTLCQMHYNEGADLLTYLVDPSVFAIKDGYVEALQGMPALLLTLYSCAEICY